MATLMHLADQSLEELQVAGDRGLVSDAIRNHSGQESIKPHALVGSYDDHGNFAGSMVMLMMLFPSEFIPDYPETLFSALSIVDETGTKAEVLRFVGGCNQKSGKGQNNYRTNLLEALLGELGSCCRHLQLLWVHVGIYCIEHYAEYQSFWNDPGLQVDLITEMMHSAVVVTMCPYRDTGINICSAHNLNMWAYFLFIKQLYEGWLNGESFPDYSSIMAKTGSSKNASRVLPEHCQFATRIILHCCQSAATARRHRCWTAALWREQPAQASGSLS